MPGNSVVNVLVHHDFGLRPVARGVCSQQEMDGDNLMDQATGTKRFLRLEGLKGGWIVVGWTCGALGRT